MDKGMLGFLIFTIAIIPLSTLTFLGYFDNNNFSTNQMVFIILFGIFWFALGFQAGAGKT